MDNRKPRVGSKQEHDVNRPVKMNINLARRREAEPWDSGKNATVSVMTQAPVPVFHMTQMCEIKWIIQPLLNSLLSL